MIGEQRTDYSSTLNNSELKSCYWCSQKMKKKRIAVTGLVLGVRT